MICPKCGVGYKAGVSICTNCKYHFKQKKPNKRLLKKDYYEQLDSFYIWRLSKVIYWVLIGIHFLSRLIAMVYRDDVNLFYGILLLPILYYLLYRFIKRLYIYIQFGSLRKHKVNDYRK